MRKDVGFVGVFEMPPNPPTPFPPTIKGKGEHGVVPVLPFPEAGEGLGVRAATTVALPADRLVAGALVDEELQPPLVAAEQDVGRALRLGWPGGEERHESVGRRAGRLVDVDE